MTTERICTDTHEPPIYIGGRRCRTIRDEPDWALYRTIVSRGEYSPDGQMARRELERRDRITMQQPYAD